MNTRKNEKERLYLGVDIGGTKVQASVVEESGAILECQRRPSPRTGGPEPVLEAITGAMEDALRKAKVAVSELTAVGVAVPGVVDPDSTRIVVAPNMNLTGVAIGDYLEKHFRVPIAVGNDGNLGTLGEFWLGSARKVKSALGIWVGTGIGAGFVQKGKLWRGAREVAGEIGHIMMQIGGPKCGCGNYGCLEALASRTAVERDIRQALEAGGKSILTELTGGDLSVIRSGALRKALKAGDDLVTGIVRRASEVLGYACLTVRHLLDPGVIILGGGMVEACSEFIMPVIDDIVNSDRLPGAREGGHVLLSALGDDAVVLGAVALARRLVGRSPFKRRFAVRPSYSRIQRFRFGEIVIGRKSYTHDVYIPVHGRVKARDKASARKHCGNAHIIGSKELELVCKGGPEVLFVGAGQEGHVELTEEAQRYLAQRAIRWEILPTAKLIALYNKSKQRKAALIHVTC